MLVEDLFTKYKAQLEDPSPVILRQVGLPFFNTSSNLLIFAINIPPSSILINAILLEQMIILNEMVGLSIITIGVYFEQNIVS